jgi:hypothetical protein
MNNFILNIFKPLLKKILLAQVNSDSFKKEIEDAILAKVNVPNISKEQEKDILEILYNNIQDVLRNLIFKI